MFIKAVSTLALAAVAIAQSLQINTPPSLITCQPAALSWSGGTGPYYIAVLPGGQSGAAPLKDFGLQQGNSLTWTVDIAAGTSVTLRVTDSTGTPNYNDAVTIQAGTDTSCIGAAAAGSASASAVSGASASMASSMSAAATPSASSAGVVSSASAAVVSRASSAAGAASSAVASVSGAAAGGVSSARNAASSVGGAAASAASGAASSGAASPFAVAPISGALAVVLGAVGLAWW